MRFDDEGADYYNEDWAELQDMELFVEDEVLPSLDGSLSYRTGEVIELLCNRRLTFLDLDKYGINIISEGKYR